MKRILALVMVLLFVLAAFPASAEGTRSQRTSLLDLSSTSSSTSNSNEGWAFNPTGNNGKPLLTLTNYGTANAHSAPIKLPKNTTVRVVGDCYIDNSVISNTIYDVIYAPVDGNLWFEGTGTLNLYAPNADKNNGKCIFLNTGGTNGNDEWLYIDGITLNCYGRVFQNPTSSMHPCIYGGLCIEITNATVRTYDGLRGIYTSGYGPGAGSSEEQQNHILIENSVVYVENQAPYVPSDPLKPLNAYGNGIFISGGRIMLINSNVTVVAEHGALWCHNNTLLVDGGSVTVISRPHAVGATITPLEVAAIKITGNTDYFYVGTHDPRYIYLAGNSHQSYDVNISSELTCTIGSYTGSSINYGLDPNRDNLPSFELKKDTTPVYHTVTFLDRYGNFISSVQVEHGHAAVAPAAPEYEGYTFVGWSADISNVTTDMTVTAQYIVNSYMLTIYYVDQEGHVLHAPYTATVSYGQSYSVASPTIEGYTPDQQTVSGTMPASNVEITVIYSQELTALIGDVDCDGDVDFDDVTLLNAYLLNAAEVTPQGLLNANVNGDNKVSSADVVALTKIILGDV